MNIIGFSAYQTVYFKKRMIKKFFKGQTVSSKTPISMKYYEALNAILVSDNEASVLVPLPNIAYIELETEISIKKEEEAKKIHSKGTPKGETKVKRPR